jgi:chemotaxis protein MotD
MTNAAALAQSNVPMPQQPGNEEQQPPPGHSAPQMPLPEPALETKPQGPAPVARETVNITVVKQETHFAPVLTTLLAGRSPAPTVQMTTSGPVPRATADEPASGRVVLTEAAEATSPGAKPLILSAAVNAAPDLGRGAQSSRGGIHRDGMAGFGPMNAMRGETGAEAAMPLDQAAATVRTEASVAGSATSSAVQIIAERIASEASIEVARASQPGQATLLAQSSPLKVLHIQLQPADLGTVTVRMSLKDKTLQLDLEVSRGETAQLLQRDKEALSSLLRSAGYLVDGMDVRMADPGAAASQTSTGGAQSGAQMQWGGQPGHSNTDARSPGGRPGEGTQRNTLGGERYGTDGQVGEPSRGGGVYV